jgi:hypothetical protein
MTTLCEQEVWAPVRVLLGRRPSRTGAVNPRPTWMLDLCSLQVTPGMLSSLKGISGEVRQFSLYVHPSLVITMDVT